MNQEDLPRHPFKFLRWFCKNELIHEIEGDLIEAYRERFKANPRIAKRKLWKEVLQSFNLRNIGIMEKFKYRSGFRQLGILSQYARVLLRTVRKSKVYSSISIISLILGISCAGLIYLYIQKELTYDQVYSKHDRIYRINHKSETSGRTYGFAPLAMTPYLTENLDAVESGVRIFKYRRAIPVTVASSQRSFNEPRFGWADEAFFELFDLDLGNGNRENILSRPNTVVISQTIARKYFGEKDPVGEVLEFNWSENTQLEIVGVYQDFPSNTSFQLDLISNLETCDRVMWSSQHLNSWQNMFVSAYLLIKPGRNDEVEKAAQEAVSSYFESESVWTSSIQPLSDIHLGVPMDIGEWSEHNDMDSLVLFGTIGIIILCLGCFNFTNMVTAQAGQRSKEVGVRKVLGSHRKQIAQQTYFETLSFVIISGVISVLLIYLALPRLGELTSHAYTFSDLMNDDFYVPYLMILVSVTLVSGVYPAFYISRIKSIQLMKKIHSSEGGRSVRNLLVTIQFTITTGLVVSTLVVYQQLQFLNNKQLGYDDSVLVNMPIHNDEAVIPKLNTFRNQLTSSPGISHMTAASHEMLSDYTYITNFQIEGSEEESLWERYTVEQGFIETFDLEILAGRPFDRSITSDSTAFVLNERAVKALGLQPEEVIGRSITDLSLQKTGKIVGVVSDFHFRSLHHEIQPFVMYVNWDRLDYITARLSSDNFEENIHHLETSWHQVFGEDVPFFFDFLDRQAADLYQREANEMQLFSTFCMISILLGSMGLFGFVLFTSERKFKEIGLRKVLGANTWEVIFLINRSFIKMLLLSFLIAVPMAFIMMSDWLEGFAYHIDQPIGAYLLTVLTVIAVASLTVSFVSWKAASANPVDSIRSE